MIGKTFSGADMELHTQQELIRLAMREAQQAAGEGNYPFGAVAAGADGKVVASAHNTQNTTHDPTAHAEVNLIRLLARQFTESELADLYLASNAESCSMCMSAAIKAGFRHFIFGAPSEPHMEPFLTVSDVLKFCRTKMDVTFGVLEEECRRQIAETRKSQGKLAQ